MSSEFFTHRERFVSPFAKVDPSTGFIVLICHVTNESVAMVFDYTRLGVNVNIYGKMVLVDVDIGASTK